MIEAAARRARQATKADGWFNERLGNCLQISLYLIRELAAALPGERAILQGGTAYWPRVANPDRAGLTDNDLFGFEWNPESPMSQWAVSNGALPEIHCWVALAERRWVIDAAAGEFPRVCMSLTPQKWPGPYPPETYIGRGEHPEFVLYNPCPDACMFALSAAVKWLHDRELEGETDCARTLWPGIGGREKWEQHLGEYLRGPK